MRDSLQFFTVKVADGSGCLFQPIDTEYSYVLTAKHVVDGLDNLEIVRQYINENGQVKDENLEIIGNPFLHTDPNKDAAIIKIKKVDNIDGLLRAGVDLREKENWYLCGHPETRTNGNFSYRKNKLTIENPVQYYIEAEIEKAVTHSEIVGQSGGGIIKSENSCFLLAGIQKKMAVKGDIESISRIHFAPLSFFDEIVEENKQVLSPLFPPYIGAFGTLIQEIFPFPNLLLKQELIRNTLTTISENICNGITPEEIITKYGSRFLIEGTSSHILYHKSLWKSLLEFFTILTLYEEPIDYNDLSSVHKKRKMFIADTDNWTKKLEEIYKSDLSEIEKGGAIVVCATNESQTNKLEISSAELAIIDISVPIDKMNISNTVENPFNDLRLVNIFKFQDCIINSGVQLASITGVNSKTKIKELTDGII